MCVNVYTHTHACIKNWGGWEENLYPPTIYRLGGDELLNAKGKMLSNTWWCDLTVVKNKQNPHLSDHIPVCFARVLSKEKGLDRHGTCVNTGTRVEAGEGWSDFPFYILACLPFVSISTVRIFLFQKTISDEQLEFEMKNNTAYISNPPQKKTRKYLAIHLTKHV